MRRVVQSLIVCLFAAVSLAQTADQELVSATDAPDPVIPGNNVTYSVTVRNNGPDPATNGGLNIILSGAVTPVSASGPPGFSCTPVAQFMTCSIPSFAAGTTANFSVVVNVPSSLLNFPDGNFTSTFTTSGVTIDPNNGNNSTNVTTSYNSPQVDLSVAVTDNPDPVFPDNNITYTIDVQNTGPNAATNVNFNVFNNSGLQFQSVTEPLGWDCTEPAPNGAAIFTCTNPSVGIGLQTFTVVLRADDAVFGLNDGSLQTAFSVNGTGDDTNDNNNTETESTAYVTPDADLTIAASDSPDPVFPDGDITYTITIENDGPDSAAATLNVPMNGTLRFTSMIVPGGFSCTGTPAAGGSASFSCTDSTFENGASAVFTIVLRANDEQFGINDQTIVQNFTVTGNVADPDNTDNSRNVSTQYTTPDANIGVTASDAPDPAVPGNNITYTGNVTSSGPDAATNATFVIVLNANLFFKSFTQPAGFTCTTPALDTNGTINCTSPSLASGANLPYTLVAQVNPALLSGPDGSIGQTFVVGSAISDPVNTNNSVEVFTSYVTPDADLSVTNADSPDPVTSGSTITYAQSLTNNGPDTATNVVFTITIPSGAGFQSLASPPAFTCPLLAAGASGTINCTTASMLNGVMANFTLVVTANAPSGSVAVEVVADSDTYDPDPLDNEVEATTSVTPLSSADLALTKTTTATIAPQGANIPYTITLRNNGPDAATNVVMTDTLPASLLFQSINEPAGFSCTTPAAGATGTITCTAATLANGAQVTFNLVARMNASTGSVQNSVSATSAAADSQSGNSSAASGPLPGTVASADVRITKTTTAQTYSTGDVINYLITVTNDGPSPATNVTVQDTIAAGFQYVSATPSQGSCSGTTTVTCTLGTLADDASATITLQLLATATSGPLNNAASVTTDGDPNAGNNSSSAPPLAQFAPGSAPTLSEWALLLLIAGLAFAALTRMTS